MPLTRLNNYISGSLAKGEDVSAEYDSIIAFCNGLDSGKLNVTGGTVSNLTVSGAFTTAGANVFNGASAFNADMTLLATKKLIAGTGSIINNAGVMQIDLGATGFIDITLAPANGTKATNKTYVDGVVSSLQNLSVLLAGAQTVTGAKLFQATTQFGSSTSTVIAGSTVTLSDGSGGNTVVLDTNASNPKIDLASAGSNNLHLDKTGFVIANLLASGKTASCVYNVFNIVDTALSYGGVSISATSLTYAGGGQGLIIGYDSINLTNGGGKVFNVDKSGATLKINIKGLPIVAGTTGDLYVSAGVLMVSP